MSVPKTILAPCDSEYESVWAAIPISEEFLRQWLYRHSLFCNAESSDQTLVRMTFNDFSPDIVETKVLRKLLTDLQLIDRPDGRPDFTAAFERDETIYLDVPLAFNDAEMPRLEGSWMVIAVDWISWSCRLKHTTEDVDLNEYFEVAVLQGWLQELLERKPRRRMPN